MEKLRIAIIGCGRIAHKSHSKALMENKDKFECVAVCDLVEGKAESFSNLIEKGGLRKPEIYTDYKKILKRSDIDVIVVATESGKHYRITMDSLDHGKHVLIEKPMALSTKHLDEIIEFSIGKKLKVGVCFQNRFNPSIQELKKKIDSGAFGEIFYGVIQVRWNRNENYYKMAKWRGTWKMDGGVLMNQSTHGIDLLQWLLGGDPQSVIGMIKNFNHPYLEVEDFGTAIVKFKSGRIGIIEATSVVYPENLEEKLSIFGKNGTAIVGGLAVNRIEVWRFPNENSHPYMNLPDPETVYGYGHVPLYADFYDAIINDRQPYVSCKEGRKAVDIVLGIYKSWMEKREIKFPFEFSTEMMENTQRLI